MSCPNSYSRHELDIEKRCLWEHCVKTYMKDFATSPCYRVIIMYVCLGVCTFILHLVNSDLLFNRLHQEHFLLPKLYGGHSLKILQVTFGINLFLLIFHYSFETSVSFAQSLWVKDLVWSKSLNDFSATPK